MSSQPSENPDFYDASAVYVGYFLLPLKKQKAPLIYELLPLSSLAHSLLLLFSIHFSPLNTKVTET